MNAKKCEVAETLKAVVMSGGRIQGIRIEQPINWQEGGRIHGKQQN